MHAFREVPRHKSWKLPPNSHPPTLLYLLSLSVLITQTNISLVAQWEHCHMETRGLMGRSDPTLPSAPDVVTWLLTHSSSGVSSAYEKV